MNGKMLFVAADADSSVAGSDRLQSVEPVVTSSYEIYRLRRLEADVEYY